MLYAPKSILQLGGANVQTLCSLQVTENVTA